MNWKIVQLYITFATVWKSWKCLSIELKVSCHLIKVKSKEISAQFYVIDIGYALLLQSNIMSFGGGEINLDISSNTLEMIALYEPNPFPQTHTPNTSFGLQILFNISKSEFQEP